MGLFTRALAVCGLFTAVALLPLHVAAVVVAEAPARPFLVEFAVAAGFVAFALLVLECALVARIRWVCEPFGNDALALFHRHVGLLAFGFTLMHVLFFAFSGHVHWSGLNPFAGSWSLRAGTIAFACVFGIVASSVWRRGLALPYEAWRISHWVFAIAIITGTLAHALLVGSASRSTALRTVLLAYAALFLAVLVHHRLLRPILLWRRPWEVVANRDQGGSTRKVELRPVQHPGFAFEAGQFVWLITGRSPFSMQQHPLSIASSAAAPDGTRAIELAIKALGNWSGSTVPTLGPGTRVWLDGPFGAFVPERVAASGFVLVGGGVGITPMRSVVLTLRDRGDSRPVLLFHAARNRERAVFADELDALARAGSVRLVPVYEEGDARPDVERGFVTEEVLRRYLPRGHERLAYFVCGPGPMIDTVETALARLGVSPERIHSERFDLV